ncbi:unnamed protein product [Closterium sp. NIES-53]
MTLRPSTAPQRVPLPSPPESSLPALTDPESDSLRAASPTVTRLLATVVTDPSFESTAASALVAELVDFAAHCRLDSATSLVAESESVCPPSVGGECALSTDVLEDRQEEFQCFAAALPHLVSMLLAPEGDPDAPDIPTPRTYAEAIEGPYSSQWQSAMDAEMASWKSTGTYVDEVPPPGANIVSGMWIFRVKRQPGSPPVFKARYVARGFSQRQGVDYFHTFSPTPKMTTLRVLLHVAAQRYYNLHSLDFSTAFLQGSLHEEIWLRRPPGFTGSFPAGTQTTLAALGFAPSTADPSLFLRTDTLLPPFYILVYVDDLVFATADTAGLAHVKPELQKRHTCTDLGELRSYLGLQITRDRTRRSITLTQSHMVQQVLQRFDFTYSSPQATPLYTRHSLSALPSDESVEPSGPYPELVGCLMYLMTCTRPDLAYPLSILEHYVAPGRLRLEHMAAAKRVLRYLCSTSGMGLVLRGRSPVVLTSHADASWVDNLATQRSSQGYTFSLGSGSREIRARGTGCMTCSSRCGRNVVGTRDQPQMVLVVSQGSTILPYGPVQLTAEGDCYLCVPPDPGIEAAALGASESVLPGTAPTEALHTFTHDSGASCCFFRDSTTLTPLSAPVSVRLADPSGGPVLARSSTVLPCLARVSVYTCTRSGRYLATLTRRPGSSLYTLATEPPQVAASAQVFESGQVAPPCSCRLLSHQTLLWHHRLGHPSPPRLRGMHSRLLFSGLPRSLPPLPPLPAPPCLPCVEGRQCAAPHSSFPPMTAPLHTLHMDVWGPAHVSGQGRERYFLLVVDDYTRYTTVFPLRSKGEWFHADLSGLRPHFDRGGEFSFDLLRDFCRGDGILHSFTLLTSPQKNGIAECRIGLVMEVARTSTIHAATPHFQCPFAVWYGAHQLNLWPRVSLLETSPTLRWTGKVGDASVFWVWGSHALVRDTYADKLSARSIPCDCLGFSPNAHGWQFYHPTSRRVFPSQDVTFDAA